MNEHVISRVVLRRFANHSRGPVTCLDLDTLVAHTDRVERVGGVRDLAGMSGVDLENIWSDEVETRLPHAFTLLDAGTLLESPVAIETVKKAIALHWARSFTTTLILEQIRPEYAKRIADRLLERFSPAEATQALVGVAVIGSDAEVLARRQIAARFSQHLRDKGFIGQQFLTHFRTAQEKVAPFALEIWRAADAEFLLADIPVVTWDKDTDQVGVLNGAAWNRADVVFMALGPRHLVALAKQPSWQDADARRVETLNSMQIRGAYREVFLRPGSGLDQVLIDALARGGRT